MVRVARDRASGIVAECEELIGGVLKTSREEVDPALGPHSDEDMGGDPMTESPGAAAVAEADLPQDEETVSPESSETSASEAD